MDVNAGDPVHPGDARLFLRLVRGILNFYSLRDVSDSKSLLQTSPIILRSLGNACQLILIVLVYSFVRLYLFDEKNNVNASSRKCTQTFCAFRPVYGLLPLPGMFVDSWFGLTLGYMFSPVVGCGSAWPCFSLNLEESS